MKRKSKPQAEPTAEAREGLKTIRGIIGRMYDNGGFHRGPHVAGEQPDATDPREVIRAALAYLDTL
jgi:hypothetical protein